MNTTPGGYTGNDPFLDYHLGGCHVVCKDIYTYMPDVWEYLVNKYGIESVLDVGCGAGWNTAWFHERGLYAVGVEGWKEAIEGTRLPLQRLIQHDYTTGPIPRGMLGKFDLAWCSEFVEHVEEKFIPCYAESFQHCHYLCMTYAVPGQGGHHHVCERDESFWIDKLNNYGFQHVEAETKYLRATDGDRKSPWGRPTLTFFENTNWDKTRSLGLHQGTAVNSQTNQV